MAIQVLVALLLLSESQAVQAQDRVHAATISGIYRDCVMACTEITLRDDFTFTYRLGWDVGPPPEVVGTWRFEAENLIVASTPERRDAYRWSASRSSSEDGFLVRVLDQGRRPLPDFSVRIVLSEGGVIEKVTDKSGTARFPWVAVRRVIVNKLITAGSDDTAVSMAVTDERANVYEVQGNFPDFYVEDELWVVREGRLFFVKKQPLTKATR